jgi:lysophospholipase L1-like esterase
MPSIRIVNMGDSITYGQHIDPAFRWTSLLQSHYEHINLHTAISIQFINRGISGETTRMGLERFPPDVLKEKPHIMTLQFGLNDCNCWLTDEGLPRVSPNAFRVNIIEMIALARQAGCEHIVLATNHVTLRSRPMLSGERYEDANQRYSQIIRDVATETRVTLCDIRKTFETFSPSILNGLLLPHPDQLHLSVEGNRMYFETILPCIDACIQDLFENQRDIGRLSSSLRPPLNAM